MSSPPSSSSSSSSLYPSLFNEWKAHLSVVSTQRLQDSLVKNYAGVSPSLAKEMVRGAVVAMAYHRDDDEQQNRFDEDEDEDKISPMTTEISVAFSSVIDAARDRPVGEVEDRLWSCLFDRWCEWLEVLKEKGQEEQQHEAAAVVVAATKRSSSDSVRGRFLYEATDEEKEADGEHASSANDPLAFNSRHRRRQPTGYSVVNFGHYALEARGGTVSDDCSNNGGGSTDDDIEEPSTTPCGTTAAAENDATTLLRLLSDR